MIDEVQALRDISQAFGGPLPAVAVRYLEQQDLLQDYQAGIITNQHAASKVAEIWEPASTSGSGNRVETVENGVSLAEKNLAFCVSEILALRARRESQVVAFRADHLDGKLLPQDKIESWVTRTCKQEGTPTMGRELVFSTKSSQLPTSIFVVDSGVLDELRRLSELLAGAYGWKLEQASSFVLGDITPISESIETGAEIYPAHPFRSRVTLKIDLTMSPREVVNAYKWARNQWFETRSRHQSIKHQTLALFYAQHVEYAEVKLSRGEQLEKWNAWCTDRGERKAGWKEDWQYHPPSGLNNFQRDSRNAYEELVRDRRREVPTS